ncbi:3-hydroxyacyl-CoA dehydrogenase NAD-binding domain-containing protein [Mesorhizobium sp.]|uniref:3-hydroxyacyl-CoA dehydrogenase NAD-binding domain-containing protein n=1 Tax=Mesorhizobium sp. TaxID=1871066 RepID=UPI00338F0E6C
MTADSRIFRDDLLGLIRPSGRGSSTAASKAISRWKRVDGPDDACLDRKPRRQDQTDWRIDALTVPGVVIASSSSGFLAADLRSRARHPERILIGHPFNLPFLVPYPNFIDRQDAKWSHNLTGRSPVILYAYDEGHLLTRTSRR